MADLDNPIQLEPSSLFYKSEEVETDLNETTKDEKPESPDEELDPESVESKVDDDEVDHSDAVDNESRIVDIDGREISVKQILDWEKNGLMQSDYTRKRQADAEAKRAWEADKQSEIKAYVSEKHSKLEDNVIMLEELIKEADAVIDWDDLREYDQGEYLRQKELKEKRQEAVKSAKEELSKEINPDASPEFIEQQRAIMVEKNPAWLKDGKETEAYKNDMKMLSEYLQETGYSSEDSGKLTEAKHWQTFLDAARYQKSLKKTSEVEAKIKKLPITTKPKKTEVSQAKSVVDLFYN